jgi:hypothetical protein
MNLADRQKTTPSDCGILDCNIHVAWQVFTKIQRNASPRSLLVPSSSEMLVITTRLHDVRRAE